MPGPGFVGTVAYRDLEFTPVDVGPKLGELSREKLVCDVMLGGEVSGCGRVECTRFLSAGKSTRGTPYG
jgi:hypothetical protein